MGMDVYGRNPDGQEGKYFRANVWSWHAIHSLMALLCSDILDDKLLRAMCVNDGAGPEDQATCDEIAERLEAWQGEHLGEGYKLELDQSTTQVDANGYFLSAEQIATMPQTQRYSPYSVEDEHLSEWITFLRHCGGFEVY